MHQSATPYRFAAARSCIGSAMVLASLMCCAYAGAQSVGDLLIAPTRVVFEGRTRTAEISLINIGTGRATYRISLTRQRMTEDGRFEEVETPLDGERFADDLVRFSPRQVVLEPRVSQVIRLQVRKPANLAPGEYRSHLLFRAVPVAPEATAAGSADTADGGLGVRLIPVYGVSIPVIVRHGETSAQVTLSDLQVLPAVPDEFPMRLALQMNRTGNQSTYGDLMVALVPAGGGEEVVVCKATGLSVYYPNDIRRAVVPLPMPDTASTLQGRLHVTYRAKPDDGGGLLAEAFLDVP